MSSTVGGAPSSSSPMYGLDHKSSLRKMPFPACSLETLARLHRQCVTFARKQPGPKETEVVLDAIDEFVFCFGSGVEASAGNVVGGVSANRPPLMAIMADPAMMELQIVQVLLEFFRADSSPDLPTLSTLFAFLFMEPTDDAARMVNKSGDPVTDRLRVMAKLVSRAVTAGSETVLHCAGAWMHQQGPTSRRSLQLARFLLRDHVLLVYQRERELSYGNDGAAIGDAERRVRASRDAKEEREGATLALERLPAVAPLFASSLVTAAAELYFNNGRERGFYGPPPARLASLFVAWLESRPSVAFASALESSGVSHCQPSTPLLGLAKWSVLSALQAQQPEELFTRMHLATLESLVEAMTRRDSIRGDVISVRQVTQLIQRIEVSIDNLDHDDENEARIGRALDALGQFLQAVTAADCLSGKTVDVIGALQNLPANRLIQLFVMSLAKGGIK